MIGEQTRRNNPRRTPQWYQLILTVISVLMFLTGTALAQPFGYQVINGTATFSYNGSTFTITNSPNAIINWQGFSIGANEITRFLQQNASSAVLNRVTGLDPSVILGSLQSNGKVFLLNPNGILFGAGSRIDVAGLVASSLNMSNTDFLAGRYNFTAGPTAGAIVNQGTITTPSGGHVWLVAPNVENSGIITAPNGSIMLAAGHSVNMVDPNNPEIAVVVSAPTDKAVNLGSIISQGGKIGIYGGLVEQKGTISADSAVRGENGRIVFKSTNGTTLDAGSVTSANGVDGGSIAIRSESGDTLVSGTVTATGSDGTGGTVHILGNRVALLDHATVDVSGTTGGGTVLIGGDYQGKNPDIQNAKATYIGSDTVIKADAITNGNGGKIIVWSDEATRVYGSISARGGSVSGNGGFIGISSYGHLDLGFGRIDTQAVNGISGTLALDSGEIIITDPGIPILDGSGVTLSSGAGAISVSEIIANSGTLSLSSAPLSINVGSILPAGNLVLTGGKLSVLPATGHVSPIVASQTTQGVGRINLTPPPTALAITRLTSVADAIRASIAPTISARPSPNSAVGIRSAITNTTRIQGANEGFVFIESN